MPSTLIPPQPTDIDQLLGWITTVKAQIKLLESQLESALDTITDAMQAGDIDPSFTYEDWSFAFHNGRLSTTYSDSAKAAIKGIQEADISSGRAIQRQGAGFWTIKAPSL
jgi:hypothetical protein